MPGGNEYVQLGTNPKEKKFVKIKNMFKRKKKGAIFGKENEKFLCDGFSFDADDFDDYGYEKDSFEVFDHEFTPSNNKNAPSKNFGGVNMQLTVINKKGANLGDAMLKKAIRESRYMGRRDWSAPDKLTATLAVLGGAGTLMEEAINTAVGSRPRIKEEVPMSMRRWSKFCTATETALVSEKIPLVGQIVSPIATAIASAAEGKSVGHISRDALAGEMASLIDGALTTVTLGVYGVVTEITGQVVAAMTCLVKAHYYHTTWSSTQNQIELKIKKLQQDYEKAKAAGLSDDAVCDYAKHIKWLQNQSKKCSMRGQKYGDIVKYWEKKFHAAAKKIGATNAQDLADYISYNEKMAANG